MNFLQSKNLLVTLILNHKLIQMKTKSVFLLALLLFVTHLSAQSVIEITYLDVPAVKINRYVELHKKMADFTMSDERTLKGQWLYRHWYGSGASVVIYDQYDSAEDAVNDDFRKAYQDHYKKLSEEQQKEMDAVYAEWWSFYKGHWDEMRVINYENYYVSKENVDWDIPYVFVVGDYNTNGNLGEFANAYMAWQIIPGVKEGMQLAGGASAHYKGTGADAQFFAAFKSITEFAEAISNQGSANAEARSKFWSMVDGEHKDQIYMHLGHLTADGFNLAGKDK